MMKKFLFLIAVFCALKTNAQTYLITFAGTGESTTVNTVKVENLTAGTSLTLNGSDILRLNVVTGVNSIEDNNSSELKIYPNPMNDNATMEIFPPFAGDAIITVSELSGKQVAQIKCYLENLSQDFRLSGLQNGFYLVNVKGIGYQFSGKLVSNGKSNGTIRIEKVNSITEAVNGKASKTDSKGVQNIVDMVYYTGTLLKFTGISGIYSTTMTDIPVSDNTITFNFMACTDGDNNNYPVVEIGDQVWMAENLKTTKYRDGSTAIPLVTDNTDWCNLTSPGYCWLDNNIANKDTYGALYNWYTVNTGNLCPTGWHVSSDDDWANLITYLGSESAGGKLKEAGTTHWLSPNTGATNETGFTALPGSYRWDSGVGGKFQAIGYGGDWWSSTEDSSPYAWFWCMYYGYRDVIRGSFNEHFGFSVRCVLK